jgi:Ca2+-binding RTX toxin-like protein
MVLAVGLLWPPAASAATLSFDAPALVYSAAPGENNMLDVRRDGTATVFTETGAAITDFPAGLCTVRGPGVVACDTMVSQFSPPVRVALADGNDHATINLPSSISVDAGEGDDGLTISAASPLATEVIEGTGGPGNDVLVAAGAVMARGGPGDDQLTATAPDALLAGEAGDDALIGSPGRDNLQGGGGRDAIRAGDGDDAILADSEFGGDDADTIDAGPGNDRVSAGGGDDTASGGPGDDLVAGDAGNDRLAGGAGTDSLAGGAGRDRLTGAAGNDSLLGGAGDDILTMGPGRDRANAGAGNDRIAARDGVAAALECGAGEDAAAPDSRDRVHLDCETIEQRVGCPRRWRQRCRVAGTLIGGRTNTVLGRGAVSVPAGKKRTLRVPVSAKGHSAVRRARRLTVRLDVAVSAAGRRQATRTRFSLRVAL